eukprot:2725121-Pleurochrysis_carterae.AAC.1
MCVCPKRDALLTYMQVSWCCAEHLDSFLPYHSLSATLLLARAGPGTDLHGRAEHAGSLCCTLQAQSLAHAPKLHADTPV